MGENVAERQENKYIYYHDEENMETKHCTSIEPSQSTRPT